MKKINLYYEAFKDFRLKTLNDELAKKNRKKLINSNKDKDSLLTLKYTCKIDPDWILEIEKGLIYIEKAIREDRQFIRSEGDVLPIEKVKKTSKDTVEHLSKHSDLITHVPENEGDPLIPDKLYVVEKLSDYLVYENRFIYMLLVYLRDFIELRITKIKQTVTSYHMEINYNKAVNDNFRDMNYKVTYSETVKNDDYLTVLYQKIPHVTKMEKAYEQVVSFLATDLMKQVSKAPMIKPPVVKTNVLRMNQNFKNSLALYDYITSYTKKGYEIFENKKQLSPFDSKIADELVETIEITHLIGYAYGQELEDKLESRYLEEQAILKRKENEKRLEYLKKLETDLLNKKIDPHVYILELKEVMKNQENEIVLLTKENDKTKAYLKEISNLEELLESKNDEILNAEKMIQEKTDLLLEEKESHALKLQELIETHDSEIEQLKNTHIEKVNNLNNENMLEINRIHRNHNEELEIKNNSYSELKANFEKSVLTLKQEKQELQDNLSLTNNNYDNCIEKNNQLSARYYGLKEQYGLNKNEDFTSKKDFKQLELEMEAYKRFFRTQWQNTKKRIKKDISREFKNKK